MQSVRVRALHFLCCTAKKTQYQLANFHHQVSRWGELVVPRRTLWRVRVRAAGGGHRHRLCSRVSTGGLRSHLLFGENVKGSVWQGWIWRSHKVRRRTCSTEFNPDTESNLSFYIRRTSITLWSATIFSFQEQKILIFFFSLESK